MLFINYTAKLYVDILPLKKLCQIGIGFLWARGKGVTLHRIHGEKLRKKPRKNWVLGLTHGRAARKRNAGEPPGLQQTPCLFLRN